VTVQNVPAQNAPTRTVHAKPRAAWRVEVGGRVVVVVAPDMGDVIRQVAPHGQPTAMTWLGEVLDA
jgi:hypothetical protein